MHSRNVSGNGCHLLCACGHTPHVAEQPVFPISAIESFKFFISAEPLKRSPQ